MTDAKPELSLGGQIFKVLYNVGIITPAKAKIMLIMLKQSIKELSKSD